MTDQLAQSLDQSVAAQYASSQPRKAVPSMPFERVLA